MPGRHLLTIPSPVVITGAARGIGLAVARLVARAGASVALLDRDVEAVEKAATDLKDGVDSDVLPIGCDVSDETEVIGAFEMAASRLGGTRGLVVSAGIDRGAPLHELDVEAWDAVHGVNLRGAFLSCRAALQQMLDGSAGSIVCISSPFAFVAPPAGAGAYCASKGGLCALVRALAVEYGEHGIRANAVLPGPTETELMWANVPEGEVSDVRETVSGAVPLARLASPDEPARAALWLLSDDASYVTGAQFACDGGVLAKAPVPV